MIELVESSEDVEAPPTEPKFAIKGAGGDRIEYEGRVDFSAAEALTYLDLYVRRGPNYALHWALRLSLGADGYAALASAESMTVDQMQSIVREVMAPLVGLVGDPK